MEAVRALQRPKQLLAAMRGPGLLVKLLKIYGLVGLIQVIAKLLINGLKVRQMFRMLKDVPKQSVLGGDQGFMGNIPAVLGNWRRVHDFRDESTRGLGVSWSRGMLLDPNGIMITVRDPACVRHFLKDAFPKYTKGSPDRDLVMFYFTEWLGDGIFSAMHGVGASDGGRLWSLQRKIAAGIFSRSNFTNCMQDVFQSKAKRLSGILQEPGMHDSPVDMQQVFFKFTMDSVMSIFFGEETDLIGGQSNEYGRAYDEAHECFWEYSFQSMPFRSITHIALPWPIGGWNGFAWRLHAAVSPLCRRFRAACRTLDVESHRLIRNCRADPNLKSRRDLLALFVQAEEKEHFSDSFLRDVVLSFVLAGRDTTACALSWMFYALAINPEIQAKLCEEVDRKFPDEGQMPGFRDLSHSEMPYLHGVLYETLRLWPPVPFDVKEAQEDDVLPDGSQIPRFSKVVFLPYAMGRDPAVYPEPEVFRPERWIPFTAPAPHEFPVFQAGPRICLGIDMAIFEAKLVAAVLLRRSTFKLAPGQEDLITYGRKLTMNVCNDKGQEKESDKLWLMATPRFSSDK